MSKLTIIDAIDKSRESFDYPEEISEENSPNYASENIIGRATPIHQFISGGERTTTFSLNIFWNENKYEVERKISWLKSFTYPETGKSGDESGAPHPVILLMGELYRNTVYIVRRVSIRRHSKFDYSSGLPCFATVDIELIEHRKMNVNYSSVRRFRGGA